LHSTCEGTTYGRAGRNKIQKLIFFMAEVWFTLSRNISRLNKKCWSYNKLPHAVEEMNTCKM